MRAETASNEEIIQSSRLIAIGTFLHIVGSKDLAVVKSALLDPPLDEVLSSTAGEGVAYYTQALKDLKQKLKAWNTNPDDINMGSLQHWQEDIVANIVIGTVLGDNIATQNFGEVFDMATRTLMLARSHGLTRDIKTRAEVKTSSYRGGYAKARRIVRQSVQEAWQSARLSGNQEQQQRAAEALMLVPRDPLGRLGVRAARHEP